MNIRECYEYIGGDYVDLMNRLPMEDLIVKFLKKYATGTEFSELEAAYASKDYETVFSVSHNLKGMTANLSLKAINLPITEICEAVRHGKPSVDLEPFMVEARSKQNLLLYAVSQLDE